MGLSVKMKMEFRLGGGFSGISSRFSSSRQ
jgi:hypothetical protein